MIYRILADLVFAAHLAFVLFAVFGGLLTIYYRRFLWLHLPALAWAAAVELFQLPCPLTSLENRFKILSGEQGYESGFIEYYTSLVLYSPITAQTQVFLGVLLILFNILVYWLVLKHRRIGGFQRLSRN